MLLNVLGGLCENYCLLELIFMAFTGFSFWGGACVFSGMCVVIIDVLVRLGRAHVWMGVVNYVRSRVHVSLLYVYSVFLQCMAFIL